MRGHQIWTAKEIHRFNLLRSKGAEPREIAADLGRTLSSITSRIQWLSLTAEQKVARNARLKERRRRARGLRIAEGLSGRREEGAPIHQVQMIVVPESVLSERAHRSSLQPRDLTAVFMGDPPPGYSALDRRLSTSR